MDRITLFFIIMIMGCSLVAAPARAAEGSPVSVRFEQTAGLIRMGDLVPVVVRIDTHGQSINATEINLTFSTIGLVVDHVSQEQSIFTVWAEQPKWNNDRGVITATAGRPNGIIASDAAVMTIYFRTPVSGLWELSATKDTRFLLNDGLGTSLIAEPVKASITVVDSLVPGFLLASQSNPTPETWTRGQSIDVHWTLVPKALYSFIFTTRADLDPDQVADTTDGAEVFPTTSDGVYYFAISQFVEGVWSPVYRRRFLVDHTAPAPFSIIRLSASELDGADALTWLANDVTSGVASVVVSVGGQTIHQPTLPLRIQPMWRGQELTVTVLDQAGNSRQATYRVAGLSPAPWWIILTLVLVALGAGGIAWWIHRRQRDS